MEASVPVFDHATNHRRRAALLEWRGWPTRILRHRHEHEVEFGLVTAGTGHYSTGNHEFELFPGRLFYIPSGVAHGSPGVDERLRCWILSVRIDRFERLAAAKDTTCAATHLHPEQARRLARMLADLGSEPDDAAFDLGAEYVAASALACLGSPVSQTSTPPVHRAVEQAARLLRGEDGDAHPMTLDELARRCGVSRSRLTALFRNDLGMSIVQFRNQERLQRCLTLYAAQPDLGMTRAAFDSGFGSYSQFYRTFCDVFGCTPADYVRGQAASSSPPSPSAAQTL